MSASLMKTESVFFFLLESSIDMVRKKEIEKDEPAKQHSLEGSLDQKLTKR